MNAPPMHAQAPYRSCGNAQGRPAHHLHRWSLKPRGLAKTEGYAGPSVHTDGTWGGRFRLDGRRGRPSI
jgi:hypothetical protein